MARFSQEQTEVLEKILSCHNITVLGQAGTGKSYIIREAKKQLTDLGKSVAVTASAGIVASQYGTQIFRHSGRPTRKQ